MDRREIVEYIAKTYHAGPEFLWMRYPNYAVFRHQSNRKWFAVVMDIPKEKLGIPEEGKLDLLNIKCDPVLVGSLCGKPGFFLAYHMEKFHWVSVALNHSVPEETIRMLLDISFDLTSPKRKKAPKEGMH